LADTAIPISTVHVDAEAEKLVLEVLRSGMLAQGPMVRRLEESFAELVGVRHVVAVNNGTTALIAALHALDLGPGDEVVTSPFTFVATLNAVLQTGATVRFADISIDDFNVSVPSMRELVNERTRVLLPVHLYGQAADMPAIAKIADAHALSIVEDAAQAHGATIDGRAVGSFGIGCFSLYATKNVTTGEGGLVTTDDDRVADHLRLLRNQGMRARYVYEMAGNNYRLTDLQAAVGIPQVERLAAMSKARRENAAYLTQHLADVPGLVTPRELPGREHVWHQYTVLLDDGARLSRDELAGALGEAGVTSGVYYPRVVFDYDCYRDDPRVVDADVPEARRAAAGVLSLPVHPQLSRADLDRIIGAVRAAMEA
jgi:dTDP-4-amino-4,6-dideoxygalactose transaminase